MFFGLVYLRYKRWVEFHTFLFLGKRNKVHGVHTRDQILKDEVSRNMERQEEEKVVGDTKVCNFNVVILSSKSVGFTLGKVISIFVSLSMYVFIYMCIRIKIGKTMRVCSTGK